MTSATATMWQRGGASHLFLRESFDRTARMAQISAKNAGETGIFPSACSPFGLHWVLILDGFQPETRLLTMHPTSHFHSIGRSAA